jgi:hypothetical protein
MAGKYPELVNELMALADEARKDLGDMDVPGANQRGPGKIKSPVPVTMEIFSK